MEQINIYEAKSRLSELVQSAAQGQEFILAKNGRPLAMLVPLRSQADGEAWQGRGFGSNPGFQALLDDFDVPLPDEIASLFEVPIEL